MMLKVKICNKVKVQKPMKMTNLKSKMRMKSIENLSFKFRAKKIVERRQENQSKHASSKKMLCFFLVKC